MHRYDCPSGHGLFTLGKRVLGKLGFGLGGTALGGASRDPLGALMGFLVLYAIRLPSNEVLQWEIAPLLRRPVGRPPRKPIIWYDDFWYQVGSWDRPRRVVAKVEWHRGELFPRVGFIVTNMSAGPEGVLHFYNGRGTAEHWINEGKYALNCPDRSGLPSVRCQPCEAPTVHPGVQPGELPTPRPVGA